MSDAEQRDRERLAADDPAAAYAAGLGAQRAGRDAEALDWFERAALAGHAPAGSAFVDLSRNIATDGRARHVARLASLEGRGVLEAGELWRTWFPAVARLAGPAATSRALLEQVFQLGFVTVPIRLAGRCDESQELVARALVALSGRRTLDAHREIVCPAEELRAVEDRHARNPFDALFLYGQTESHYSRLLEGLLSFCTSRRIRPILGIRRDAWDGDRFTAFTEGVELEVPRLDWTVPAVEAPRWIADLLREIGALDVGPRPDHTLAPFARVDWAPWSLVRAARRCLRAVVGGADLEQGVSETVELWESRPRAFRIE